MAIVEGLALLLAFVGFLAAAAYEHRSHLPRPSSPEALPDWKTDTIPVAD